MHLTARKTQDKTSSVNTADTKIKWAAKLDHVREVSVLGTADLAYWKARLRKEDLVPVERDGRAQILIIAADMKFGGVRFRELSFSVLVSGQACGIQQEASYLIRAFSSSRLFAFCERAFFSTPYLHGDVRLPTSLPASIQLLEAGESVFHLAMQADSSVSSREPLRSGDEGLEGAVFLPKRRGGSGRDGKLFFARIQGHTRTYPFLPAKDSLTIRPSSGSDVPQMLIDSQLVAKEWAIRADASHAKSRTYKRAGDLSGLRVER